MKKQSQDSFSTLDLVTRLFPPQPRKQSSPPVLPKSPIYGVNQHQIAENVHTEDSEFPPSLVVLHVDGFQVLIARLEHAVLALIRGVEVDNISRRLRQPISSVLAARLSRWRAERVELVRAAFDFKVVHHVSDEAAGEPGERVCPVQPTAVEFREGVVGNQNTTVITTSVCIQEVKKRKKWGWLT
jgi:hypothetical protein